MKNITARPFRLLADHMAVYDFMVDIYERDWKNGVPAPFLEYAFSNFPYWMNLNYSYKNRIWEDEGKIVAFCFYENPVNQIYFSLKPGYEDLAAEMVAYADRHMPLASDGLHLILFQGQKALMNASAAAGYRQISQHYELAWSFEKPLDYPLPEDFHFVAPQELDMIKVAKCCWKGFDHEETEGPWNFQQVHYWDQIKAAPHATFQYAAAIADKEEEYACWAGMWWVPENRLAYMEPLCTIPEYRRLGLARAALSELYHRMKPLGATHMTGGGLDFYKHLGFEPAVLWTHWEK